VRVPPPFPLQGGGGQGRRRWSSKPIVEGKIRNAVEVPRIVGYQLQSMYQGRCSDQEVEISYHLSGCLQTRLQGSELRSERLINRDHLESAQQKSHLLDTCGRVHAPSRAVVQFCRRDRGYANVDARRDRGEPMKRLRIAAKDLDHCVGIEQEIHRLGPPDAVREFGHSRRNASMPGSACQMPANFSSQSREEISTVTGVSSGSSSGRSGTTTPPFTLPGIRVIRP